jgi:regulatory protein
MAGRRRREGFNEKRERLGAVEDPAVVLEAALRFLEPRQRSIGEVRRRLSRVGYRDELVEGAIARLVELGVLDDEAFARTWIESRDRARPRGERALRFELARKGIDRKTADETIAARAADHPEADAEAATRLLARNARSLARVPDLRSRRQRAYALLARAGFDSEIAAAASRAMDAPRDGDDDEDAGADTA